MDFNTYTFRSHQFGKIVGASGKMTDGNKTYLREVYAGAVNGVRKEVTSKYFEKGLFEEQSGIDLLNDTIYKGQLVVKNKERKNNGFIQGECDVIKDGYVYDIKNAWDVFTFENSSLSHEYKWQLKCYMWLWGVSKARLFYCLNNTPDHIFESEARKMLWGNFISEDSPEYIEAYNNLKAKHTHDSKPIEERFKVWDISLEEGDIDKMKVAVVNARKYLCELDEERNERIAYNRLLMNPSKLTIHDGTITVHEIVKP